jgi:hypothetical protein
MIYEIVVEPLPKSVYTPGFSEKFDPEEETFSSPPRSVETRALLLTMFGDVTVFDSSGNVVYTFPYRDAKDKND